MRLKVDRAERLSGTVDQALIVLDLSGHITEWNIGTHIISSHTDAELLGGSGHLLFLPHERDVFTALLRRAAEDGYVTYENWHLRRDGCRFWATGSLSSLCNDAGQVNAILLSFRDSTMALEKAEHHAKRIADADQRHRTFLELIQAIAKRTLRHGVADDVRTSFLARLQALACSHDVAAKNTDKGTTLAQLLQSILLPHNGPERCGLRGPSVWLPVWAIELLGLAFHELAANAVQHGALSCSNGHVAVSWQQSQASDGTSLVEIVWVERGGPNVSRPMWRGFGLEQIDYSVSQGLAGTVTLDFQPCGLECRMRFPCF